MCDNGLECQDLTWDLVEIYLLPKSMFPGFIGISISLFLVVKQKSKAAPTKLSYFSG